MDTRRVVSLVVASLALAASGCGNGGIAGLPAGNATHAAAPVSERVQAIAAPAALAAAPLTGPRELPASVLTGHVRRDATLTQIVERRRHAALAKARRSRTVRGALRSALLARRITRAEHNRLRAEYDAARTALRRLSGTPRAELASVIRRVDALAKAQRLNAGRFTPVFLVLRRNREYWSTHATAPAAGYRLAFARDPAVFQYYPGQGIQLQQLASWGRLNARLAVCLRQARCPFAKLRDDLDRMVKLGATRGGFLAWESYFSFGGGNPPWISGMTQGTAVQALARGAIVLDSRHWQQVAESALGAFDAPPPTGVAAAAPGGRHYLMYSFAPELRILNGDLQAITGLRDLADLGGSHAARVLYRRGEGAVRKTIKRFDTGAWSLYSEGGRESTLGYHQLVGEFLGNLCKRTHGATYCAAHLRFSRYEREAPRIRVARPRGLHAKRATSVRFSLSKLSTVAVRVTGPDGFSFKRRASLTRGNHTVTWTPPDRGRYRITVVGAGPSGPSGAGTQDVRVVLPKPKPKKPKADATPTPAGL